MFIADTAGSRIFEHAYRLGSVNPNKIRKPNPRPISKNVVVKLILVCIIFMIVGAGVETRRLVLKCHIHHTRRNRSSCCRMSELHPLVSSYRTVPYRLHDQDDLQPTVPRQLPVLPSLTLVTSLELERREPKGRYYRHRKMLLNHPNLFPTYIVIIFNKSPRSLK